MLHGPITDRTISLFNVVENLGLDASRDDHFSDALAFLLATSRSKSSCSR